MFKTRLLSGIMLMIIALTTVIAGGQVLFTVLFAISLIGMSELYKVFGIEKKAPGIVGYIFAFGYYALIYMEANRYEPQIARRDFHVAKMTSATASQPRASIVPWFSQVPLM